MNDLPGTTRLLALSLGDTLNVASSAPGGYTFEQHSTNATTLGLIASQPWDFVILQEQSQRPSFPPAQVEQEVYPFAAQLVDSILDERQLHATGVLHRLGPQERRCIELR